MGDKDDVMVDFKEEEKVKVKAKKVVMSPEFIAAKQRDLEIEVAKKRGGLK